MPNADRPASDFEHSIRRGTRWALISQLASQLLSVAALAALCRLIDPDSFGVFSMALLLVTMPRTFATAGLGAAIVQRAVLPAELLSPLFWLSCLVGLACAVVSALAGGLLAWQTGTSDLAILSVALAGTSLVATLGTTHQALLERRLALPAVQRARLAAQAVGAAASVAAAWANWQAWALVVQQYVELALLSGLMWKFEPWRPASPSRGASYGGLARFGGYYSLANLAFYFGQNCDKLILYIGLGDTQAGQASIGMYSLAFNLVLKPISWVTSPVSAVMLPALSRAADDARAYARLVSHFLRMSGTLLLPAGAGLWLVASDASVVLAGSSWTETGALLRALAPLVLVQGFINLCGSVLAARGQMRHLLVGSLVVSALLIQGCLAGYWLGGRIGEIPVGPALGVAQAYALVTVFVLFGPYLAYCLRATGVAWRDVFGPLGGAVRATVAMSVIVWLAQRGGLAADSLPPLLRLAAQVGLGIGVYALLARRDVIWLCEVLVDRRTTAERTA